MYLSFYGLTAKPFQLRPDAHFFYDSAMHRCAMAYLDYGLAQSEGFIVISGEAGAGKTTLLRKLFETLDPGQVHAARIGNTDIDGEDLLRKVAAGFALPSEPISKPAMLDNIEAMLRRVAAQGRRSLLVVDEAHLLSARAIEELRVLSTIRDGQRSLLQIFLFGQPGLRATLQGPAMQALRQRVIAAHHLGPLDARETRAYIEHRLRVAGWSGNPSIGDDAFAAIFKASGGIARHINAMCERLLVLGTLDQARHLNGAHVASVARELAGQLGRAPAPGIRNSSGMGDRATLRVTDIEQSMLAMLGAVQALPALRASERS
jgi:general secretion pathway protein A